MAKKDDKFRSSKDVYGGVTVIRKDSKYDRNAKEDAERKRNYFPKDNTNRDKDLRANADGDVARRVKRSAQLAKESKYKENKDYSKNYDRYEGSSRETDRNNAHYYKQSTGRKDFPFFKHTTKGK